MMFLFFIFQIPYSLTKNKEQNTNVFCSYFAESKGFEPLEPLPVHFFSKEALSTTQPTLLNLLHLREGNE